MRINEPYQKADEALAAQVDALNNRVEALEQPRLGTQYVSATNTRQKIIKAGEIFVLPVEYVVGGGQLHVFVDGVLCFPGENFAYVEVGNPGSYSTEIKFNQDMLPERDIRVHIFVMASEKYIKLDESLSLEVVKHLLDRYAINYKRKDIVVDERIEAYVGYTVPEFVVGANNLTVFLNGKLLRPNEDYIESGDAGNRSTTITFIASVEVNTELTFITPAVILDK